MFRSAHTASKPSKSTIKFLCSYGGRILPRYPDGKLRYLGGHTRVLAVDRSITFSGQFSLSLICSLTHLVYFPFTKTLYFKRRSRLRFMINNHNRLFCRAAAEAGRALRCLREASPLPITLRRPRRSYLHHLRRRSRQSHRGIRPRFIAQDQSLPLAAHAVEISEQRFHSSLEVSFIIFLLSLIVVVLFVVLQPYRQIWSELQNLGDGGRPLRPSDVAGSGVPDRSGQIQTIREEYSSPALRLPRERWPGLPDPPRKPLAITLRCGLERILKWMD
ncbi:hypothetical protein VIGAN_10092900 [Vigna angularis var. angularis]|uniref:Uncharacterized protein n=1 Tax=Vigna angularis var. angularis TaxID=157739 RepID=A0A0S3T315_PHAAN|nr:hypothetical protein VIGAN_10092900 [Vigna angularis var. angularis]